MFTRGYRPGQFPCCWWTPLSLVVGRVGWVGGIYLAVALLFDVNVSTSGAQSPGVIHPTGKTQIWDGWNFDMAIHFYFLGVSGTSKNPIVIWHFDALCILVDIQMRFRPSWQWITMPTTPKFPGPYGCGGQQPWWGLAVKLWAIVSIWQQISLQLAGSHISLFPLLLW